MKTFIYYSKNDPNKEAISKLNCFDISEATNLFSTIKNLPTTKFNKLFKVEGYGTKNEKINF